MRQFRERIRNPDIANNNIDNNDDDAEEAVNESPENNHNDDPTVINNTEEEQIIVAEPAPTLRMVFSNMIYMFFASLFPENIQANNAWFKTLFITKF